jgi:hypothetical protein
MLLTVTKLYITFGAYHMSKLLKNTVNAINAIVNSKTEEFKLPAYVVLADVKRRNAENECLYNEQQLLAGEALLAGIEDVYLCSRVFLNYRQRFIAVKVNAPSFKDKVSLRAAKLDAWCEANGIVKEHTRHGHIVYRANADALDNISVTAA